VVLSNGEGELIKAVAVKNLKEVITNLREIKRHLNPIKEFLKTGFAVFFDREFAGASFQLPTVLNLYVEKSATGCTVYRSHRQKGKHKVGRWH
jgi:hypothetical protein